MKNGGKQNVRGVKIWGKINFFVRGAKLVGKKLKKELKTKMAKNEVQKDKEKKTHLIQILLFYFF